MLCRIPFRLSLFMLSLLVVSCNRATPPPLPPAGTPVGSALAPPPSAAAVDLSVPEFDPKPVVWMKDWTGVEAEPLARQEAQKLKSIADQLKASERFAEAEQYYQQAMEADSTWGYPPYQLACNYELWHKHDQAIKLFARAVELGFDDFPTALGDDELGQLRDDPSFPATLMKIRERYVLSSSTMVGQPIAVQPRGTKPDEGWPVMLLLHGYGDSNLNYLDFAQEWSKLGFLAVAVPGSVPAGDGYIWSIDSTDPTHRELQAIITSPLFQGLANPKQAFLLGFSQGALHAMLLTSENPDIYAGVVGLSPGGSLADQLATPPINRSGRPARCVFIHGDQEPHAPYVPIWSNACRSAGWKFDSHTHPGGHHFPENWDSMRTAVATFLIE